MEGNDRDYGGIKREPAWALAGNMPHAPIAPARGSIQNDGPARPPLIVLKRRA